MECYLQKISVIFATLDNAHVSGDLMEIPQKDLRQHDLILKEPIQREDLAKALESLAKAIRNG